MKLLSTFLICTTAALSQQRDPILDIKNLREITPRVYVIEDKDTTPGVPNVGIITGSRATLVIDTGMGPRNGQIIVDQLEKIAPEGALYLVTTHVHPEHDLGAEAFPSATKMIRSSDQEKDIEKNGYKLTEVFMQRSAINKELLTGAKFRKAEIHFDKDYDLDLGGITVHITSQGPDHTIGDTAIWLPAQRVLFSGDLAMRGMPAFLAPDSSLNHWLTTLDYLASLKPAIIVPSHGPIGDASYITNYQAELTTVRDRTIALKKQGKSLEETTTAITTELSGKYPDQNRLKGAILSAYNEAP